MTTEPTTIAARMCDEEHARCERESHMRHLLARVVADDLVHGYIRPETIAEISAVLG